MRSTGRSTTRAFPFIMVLCFCLTVVLTAANAAAKPVTIFHADDIIPSPRPTAATRWTNAPGRHAVSLAAAGAELRGYVYSGSAPNAPMMLLFGGNGYSISSADRGYRTYARFSSRVVTYDYRGYGFSTGRAHFADFESDAVRILEYQDPKHSYVLRSDAKVLFHTVAMMETIRAPLRVLQGTRDEVIAPTQGRTLERAAASADKRFVPIVGAKHSGLLRNGQTQTAVHNFLEHESAKP